MSCKATINLVLEEKMHKLLISCMLDIKKYHEQLGWPDIKAAHADEDSRIKQHIQLCTALTAEVYEVLNAAPWKPWKSYKCEYDGADESAIKQAIHESVTEELVDVFFFICSLCELWDISPAAFEDMISAKLVKNYERLRNRYNRINAEKEEEGTTNDTGN